MKIEIEVKESMGIIEIYEAVARAVGIHPDDVGNYDCREISVSNEIADAVQNYYKENFGVDWKIAFGMHWLNYGAKVDEKLSGGEVEITEKFIELVA